MKKLKYFKLFIFSVFMIFSGALFSANAEVLKHTELFYINDFAHVLSADTQEYILKYSKDLNDRTGAQLVVTTVESLDGMNEAEYALKLLREWEIGSKEKNNGLIVLLAPNEGKIRVEVGYGLEGKINDAKAGRFIDDYAIEHFKNHDWDKGVLGLYSELLSEIYAEYGLEAPENVSAVAVSSNQTDDSFNIVFYVIIALVFGVALFVPRRKRPARGGAYWTNWYDTPAPRAGYDGDVDWTDWHSGSGGSFGGGGFSGGGGSGGGGGASRNF